MQTKHAAFFIPTRYERDHERPLRKNSGFEPKAKKLGEDGKYDIWRLTFPTNQLLKSRLYLVLGRVINRRWQDVEELKVYYRDETYVDVLVPPEHGCMFILIAP
jgi:hypothetical protein